MSYIEQPYWQQQRQALGVGEHYRLKIIGEEGRTNWLTINSEQMEKVFAIFRRETE